MAVDTTADKRLLEPISTVTSVALRLVTGVFLGVRLWNLLSGGFGEGSVCGADLNVGGSPGEHVDSLFAPAHGVSVDYLPKFCVADPSTGQRILDQTGPVLSAVLLIGGLFLLDRALRGAAREGVHTERTADRLRLLGRWLLAGSLVTALGTALAHGALLHGMRTDQQFAAVVLGQWDTPWFALLTGLGLLTFARIVRAGAALRADLEGVV